MGARHAVQVRGVADAIQRTVSGKADYGWARAYAAGHAPDLDRVSGAHSQTSPR